MAAGEGIITRKEIITDEALAFGTVYKKNVDQAIDANKILIDQFKILFKVSGDYRKAQDNYDYRKAKQEESIAHQKILNELKQMATLEKELEKIKREKLKTDRELIKVAQENIRLSILQAQRTSSADKEIQKLRAARLAVDRELARVAQENQRLSDMQARSTITNQREIARAEQERLRVQREQARLDIERIRLQNAVQAQTRRSTTLTMEERVQRQLSNRAEREATMLRMGLIGAYQRLNKQRTEAKKRLQDLIAAGNASNRQIRQAQREFDALDRRIRRADSAVRDFTRNVGNYRSALSGISNLMGAFGIIGGLTGLVTLGKSIYETTKQIQGQEIALKMLSETEAVYAKNKEFLIRISEQYGLELMTTTNAYKNYFASAKTSIEQGKLSFEDMQMIFEKVSKSASMLGLSVEQQEGTFLALSQMLSKGTVQSEELRGQLGERLPGAFEVMAKALGVTTMQLGDMLKKGEVLAADVLPRFAAAYEKAIGADQIERTETLAAAQNRASNKWTEFIDNLNKGQGTISSVGVGFFNLTGTILDLIGAKEDLIKKIFDEQLGLNTLINKITSLNEDNSERVKLIEELKSSYPEFIKYIKDEDFSNANLRRTLVLVNDEYRNRILLQEQVARLEKAQADRDKSFQASTRSRLDLYNKLNKLNTEYNLGFNLTVENADKLADEIQKTAELKLGFTDALKYIFWDDKRIDKLQKDIEIFSNAAEEKNKTVGEEIELQKKLQDETGLQTEEQLKQVESNKSYNKTLEERIAIATKLGGVLGKDFSEFDLAGINSFISSKTNSSGGGGESEKERKKREAAERKAQKEADKRDKERLKKQKEAYEAEIDLLIWRADSKAEIFKAESINEESNQEERYNALIASQKAEEESLRLNAEKQLTISRAFQEGKKAFTETEISDMINNIQIKSDITNNELLILEKFYAAQAKLRKDNEKGLADNVEFEVNQLKKRVDKKAQEINYDNDKLASDEINKLSIGDNLTDVENYEKKVYEIKRKYLLLSLQQQLAVLDKEIEIAQTKGAIDKSILDKQLKLRNEIKEFENESHVDTLMKAKEMEQRFIEMGENIKNALVDLTNAIFDNRIQKIDEDIERTNEQYEKQIELYEGDAARQKLIREQQEREREKLEAKKRKEQHKQAVFNKAMAIADIGWSTAQAIIKAMADPGGYAGIVLAIGAGVAGAIQTAAVLATPIPKYKMGREGGPEEFAIVGEGGVHEVIEHKDGSAEITPKRDTLVKLLEGDKVHSSIDKYRQARRSKFRNDLVKEHIKMESYLNKQSAFDGSGLERKLDDLISVTKKKTMSTVVNVPKSDMSQELWKLKQVGIFR